MGDRFANEALDELLQVKQLLVEDRRTLVRIALETARGDRNSKEAALARSWLLGAVESTLWRIESRLKGGVFE